MSLFFCAHYGVYCIQNDRLEVRMNHFTVLTKLLAWCKLSLSSIPSMINTESVKSCSWYCWLFCLEDLSLVRLSACNLVEDIAGVSSSLWSLQYLKSPGCLVQPLNESNKLSIDYKAITTCSQSYVRIFEDLYSWLNSSTYFTLSLQVAINN